MSVATSAFKAVAPNWTRREVSPSDILSGLRTLSVSSVNTCTQFDSDWRGPREYVCWAQAFLQEETDRALDAAVTYAKRAVCCRIDGLLLNNHVRSGLRRRFPEKMELLSKLGISAPSVVNTLAIEPRNELEHAYGCATKAAATCAVELAELFLGATETEADRPPIIGVAWTVNYQYGCVAELGERARFNGFRGGPMLFVDVFEKGNEAAKLIYPDDAEIWYAPLAKYSVSDGIELANHLRSHYAQPSRGQSGMSTYFYSEIKRQSGM